MSLRCNVCTLADSWTAKCPVLCHLFRCFDPRFKENALCHPAFFIRDINICRNSYSQGRLKSRKSYHCCKCYRIQISYKTHHKTFRHFVDIKRYNSWSNTRRSCRIKGSNRWLFNVLVKNGGGRRSGCDGITNCILKWSLSLDFKRSFKQPFPQLLISLMMKTGWQWIFSLNLGSKQRNRCHKTAWTFRNPRIKESAKSHPSDMYNHCM